MAETIAANVLVAGEEPGIEGDALHPVSLDVEPAKLIVQIKRKKEE